MKRLVFLCVLAGALMAGGCGSSSSSVQSVPPRYVPVTVVLDWPALSATTSGRSVAAPVVSESAVILVTDLSKIPATPTDLVPIGTVNRKMGVNSAYSQTFTSKAPAGRPNQLINAEIEFFSNTGGGGTLVGTVKKSTILPVDGDLGTFNVATGATTP